MRGLKVWFTIITRLNFPLPGDLQPPQATSKKEMVRGKWVDRMERYAYRCSGWEGRRKARQLKDYRCFANSESKRSMWSTILFFSRHLFPLFTCCILLEMPRLGRWSPSLGCRQSLAHQRAAVPAVWGFPSRLAESQYHAGHLCPTPSQEGKDI